MDAYPTLPLLTVPLGKRRITGIDKWLSAAWVEEWKHRDPNQHAFIWSGIHTAHQAKGGNWQVDQAVASLHLHFWMYAGKTIWWWAHERTRAHLHSHSKKKGSCVLQLSDLSLRLLKWPSKQIGRKINPCLLHRDPGRLKLWTMSPYQINKYSMHIFRPIFFSTIMEL